MLRKFLTAFAALAALFLVSMQPAAAQQRIALVIGNAAYPKGPLQTSLADGGLVAEALTSIGFEILEGADVNTSDMRRLFRDFLDKVNAAGPDTIAFIYYNGYALQFEGDNYLIPVDAQLNRDSDIPIEGVRLFDLLRPLADTPATTKIVVLDATRPLPFQPQGGQLARSLGAIESAPGMIVGFSAAPGVAAADGPGPYGPYATAIAEMVREPGLDIDTMFARIRLRTNEATNGVQTPWEVSQLQRVVMLVPGQAAAPPPGAPQGLISAPQTQVGAPVVRRRAPPRPIRDYGPEEAYAYAVEQDDLPIYVEFVQAYPDSPYAARVWATIRARREALVWRHALLVNSPEAYWTYAERYPDGMYVFDARRRLRRLAVGDRPPPGFRMLDFADVPPPIAGEPARLFDVYPSAPPPRRYLGAPPAFIVGLPPPPRPGGGGLWRRPQSAFPVIIAPPPRGAIGIPKGPTIVNQPPPGQPQPGFQGPPPQWQKPGTGIGSAPPAPPPPGPPPGFQKKGPAVVNQPPPGAPPAGPQPGFQKKGPAVVNQPPPGAPPPGFQGPPKQWQKPGTGIGSAPPAPPPPGPPPGPPKGPAVVNQPPPGPPKGFKGPPPGPPAQQQLKQIAPPQQPKAAAPPPPPPPKVAAPPPPPPPKAPPPPPPPKAPPPPPPPPAAKAPPPPPPPPPQAQKGPPPGAKQGLPKCATVGGKQPCAP